MNREEMTLLGFEIVAYAGDARSKLLEALKAAENGDFAKADSLVVEAGSCIAEAHNSQTAMLAREASGGGTSIQCYYDAWSGSLDDYDLIKRCDSSPHRTL